MLRNPRPNNEGLALVLAIVFVCVAVTTVSTVTMRLVHHMREVDRFAVSSVCFQGAEFALAQSVDRLAKGENGSIGLEQWQAPDGGGFVVPSFNDAGVAPEHIASTPEIEYFCLALDWARDGLDNNGDGIADGVEEENLYTVYAFARARGNVRCVEAVLRAGETVGLEGRRVLRRLSWRERQCTHGVMRPER